jgi:hypothetical protein
LQSSIFNKIYDFLIDQYKYTRYCEKEKDKANKRILRSLSFDNNGLVKSSCGTVALYGPFGFLAHLA